MKKNPAYLFLIFLFMLSSCQSGIFPVSQRGIDGFNKPGTPVVNARALPSATPAKVFKEEQKVAIVEKNPSLETGSLYQLDDQRNYLFLSKLPYQVGQFIEVSVVPAGASENKTDDKKKDPAADKAKPNDSGDEFVKKMLADLPQLDPGPIAPKLLPSLRMRIEALSANGDLVVSYRRASQQGQDVKEVNIAATIPYAAINRGDGFSTRDLTNISWSDNSDGSVVVRTSNLWEDEYSLRLSGFTEAKSMYARQLEDKRKQLQAARTKLNNELISLGKERKKIAEEREQALKMKSDAQAKMDEMQKAMAEQTSELESLREKEKQREATDAAATASADAAKSAPPTTANAKAPAAPAATPAPAAAKKG